MDDAVLIANLVVTLIILIIIIAVVWITFSRVRKYYTMISKIDIAQFMSRGDQDYNPPALNLSHGRTAFRE